jgi:adenine deaminase
MTTRAGSIVRSSQHDEDAKLHPEDAEGRAARARRRHAGAKRNGVKLPYGSVKQLKAAYDFDDLPSFLAVYYEGMSVLLKEPDFYDLAYAYLAKAHSQNVVYAEMFFDPQAHTARGVAFDTVIRGIRRAQLDAERRLGIRSQLIMCFLRDWSAEFAMATLLESLPYKQWIVGVGLDSDEKNNPPIKFKAVFKRAREEGYLLTMHCDVDQQDSVGHIWQCLRDIDVARIDHGVNAIEDPKLCAEIKRRGLALTVCPISNSYVTDGTRAAAIKAMLDRGMRVTINSDDPAYFPGYMTENLIAVHEEVDLTKAEIIQLARNAFEAAWLPRKQRDEYLTKLDAYAA